MEHKIFENVRKHIWADMTLEINITKKATRKQSRIYYYIDGTIERYTRKRALFRQSLDIAIQSQTNEPKKFHLNVFGWLLAVILEWIALEIRSFCKIIVDGFVFVYG